MRLVEAGRVAAAAGIAGMSAKPGANKRCYMCDGSVDMVFLYECPDPACRAPHPACIPCGRYATAIAVGMQRSGWADAQPLGHGLMH